MTTNVQSNEALRLIDAMENLDAIGAELRRQYREMQSNEALQFADLQALRLTDAMVNLDAVRIELRRQYREIQSLKAMVDRLARRLDTYLS